MLVDLSEFEYAQMQLRKSRQVEEVVGLSIPLLRIFATRIMCSLSSAESSICMYILGITVASGRTAREVSIAEFGSGIRDSAGDTLSKGTGLSRMTIKRSVKNLVESDVINAYRRARKDGSEYLSRLYEINFNLFLSNDTEDSALETAIVGANKGDHSASGWAKFGPPLHNIYMSSVATNEIHGDTSISFLAGSSVASETLEEESNMPGWVGKKGKPDRVEYSSAIEAVRSIQARSEAKASVRVTSATSKEASVITSAEMQALFDKHAKAAGIEYRLVVTKREYGLLRKRLAQSSPKDFSDMVRWSLLYWPTLSQQSRRAVVKSRDRLVAGKALPEAQHFNTFAYWYPYFLKAYQNHLAGNRVATADQQQDTALRRQVTELERELKSVTLIARRRTQQTSVPTPPTAPRPRRILPAKTADADLFAKSDLPPEWK